MEYPFLENTPTHQILHTENYVIPLGGNNFELKQHPDSFAWYVKDHDNQVKPRYVAKLELRSNAIPRVAPVDPPKEKDGEEELLWGLNYFLLSTIFFSLTNSLSGYPLTPENEVYSKIGFYVCLIVSIAHVWGGADGTNNVVRCICPTQNLLTTSA